MKYITLAIFTILSFGIIADDDTESRFTPDNAEQIEYALSCQCLTPVEKKQPGNHLAEIKYVEGISNKLIIDQILLVNVVDPNPRYDVKYLNGPWSWSTDFGKNGVSGVRNVNHRGFITRAAAYDTEMEKRTIQNEWANNPPDYWKPNDIRVYAK